MGEAWERASAKAKMFELALTMDEAAATVNDQRYLIKTNEYLGRSYFSTYRPP